MASALSQLLPTSENHVLRMLSHGAPMTEVLSEPCNFIDAKLPGAIPTFLLPNSDGTLSLAAGPKIPKLLNQALEGMKVSFYPTFSEHGRTRGPVLVTDIKEDPPFAACWNQALNQDIRAAYSVPIFAKDRRFLGTLILFYQTPQRADELDLEHMERAIHMAAIAIDCNRDKEELREFAERLYQSQDEEHRRMARELHDSTGQKLAALAINLSRLKKTTPAPPSDFEALLLQCASLTKNISDELRTLCYLLHPPLLEELGLNVAIQAYVQGINQRNSLRVKMEITHKLLRLSKEAELAIFRIVQASLTNVHLHSGVSEATVKIGQNIDGLVVEVSDQGQGIPNGVLDHSSRTKTVGIGIAGMRERVRQLGGRLEIETNRNGTRVRATIPNNHFRTAVLAATAL